MEFSIKGSTVHDKMPRMKVYKCKDCEIEISVHPAQEHNVKRGNIRCNNPRCPGARRGGGRYVRK